MKTIEERIAEKQIRRDGCWGWAGAKTPNGYPSVKRGRRGEGDVMVHRYVMGEPKGLVVMHKCDNRECTNPDHLEIGTQKKNIRDCWARGRRRQHPFTKVSDDEVIAAEFVRALTGLSGYKMARELGISRTTYYERVARLRRKGKL